MIESMPVPCIIYIYIYMCGCVCVCVFVCMCVCVLRQLQAVRFPGSFSHSHFTLVVTLSWWIPRSNITYHHYTLMVLPTAATAAIVYIMRTDTCMGNTNNHLFIKMKIKVLCFFKIYTITNHHLSTHGHNSKWFLYDLCMICTANCTFLQWNRVLNYASQEWISL